MIKDFLNSWGLKAVALVVAVSVSVIGVLTLQLKASQVYAADQHHQLVEAQRQHRADLAEIHALETINRADRQIHEEVSNAIQNIQQAEGADQLVPPDVAHAWATGIDRLRNIPDDQSGGDATSALPSARTPGGTRVDSGPVVGFF